MKTDGHIIVLLLVIATASMACRTGGPNPVEMLPRDAGALFSMRPVAEVGRTIGETMEQVPGGRGIADLVRSITGIDISDEHETRLEGFDPDRGIAAAIRKDGLVVILPVEDETLVSRRLGLRLSRLGFIEDDGVREGIRTFESTRGDSLRAGIRVSDGLAFVCIGDIGMCSTGMRRKGGSWLPEETAAELGMNDAVVMGVVRAGFLEPALDAAGLPLKGTARAMIPALLGDLRWAIGFDNGVRVRLAAGPAGQGVEIGESVRRPPEGLAMFLSASVPKALVGNALDGVLADGMQGLFSSWTGECALAIKDDPDAEIAPLVMDERLLARPKWIAGARLVSREDADTAVTVLTGLAEDNGWSVDRLGESVPGTTIRRNPFSLRIRAEKDMVYAGADTTEPAVLSLGGDSGRVVHVAIDPGAILRVFGGGGVEFLGHMVGAIKGVFVDLYFNAGRLVMDAGVDFK